ncbi:hypothetical protein TcWFU_002435 [Taenia crassiceps]|uniref:Uncharacterized protein n=1 Tax=Taenia crassiceps TaxID=6207 RepID=A0ABR4QJE5_9CEST
MSKNSETLHLSSRPDLLNIDREYADNLKILLDNSPSKGLVQLKVASICNNEKNESSSSINGLTSSPADSLQKSLPPLAVEATTSDDMPVSQRNNGLKSISEEIVSSNREVDVTNVKVSTPVARSKSFGRKNMSARIQSLLENFESSDYNINSSSSLPETPRNIEKRPAKQLSSEASMSENKSSAEACFACNKVLMSITKAVSDAAFVTEACRASPVSLRRTNSFVDLISSKKPTEFSEECQRLLRLRVTPKMWRLIRLLSNKSFSRLYAP